MQGAAQAIVEFRRLPSLASTADRQGKRLDAALREIRELIDKYQIRADFFKDVEPLTAWQLYDELLAIVGEMYAYLNSVEMEAEIAAVERRKHKLGTRARRVRDELLPMLSVWRDSLIALRSTLRFQFGGRGIRLMKEAITAELAEDQADRSALEMLADRFREANPGDHILFGDVADTSKRVFRRALDMIGKRQKAARAAADAVKPPSEEELEAARDAARREDGSTDALLLAAGLATDFGEALVPGDRLARFGHPFDRHRNVIDDDE